MKVLEPGESSLILMSWSSLRCILPKDLALAGGDLARTILVLAPVPGFQPPVFTTHGTGMQWLPPTQQNSLRIHGVPDELFLHLHTLA